MINPNKSVSGEKERFDPDPWWPSPYGAGDQIGMLNEITQSKVIEALSIPRLGIIYDLGHILDEKFPAFPGRSFHQHLVTSAHLLNLRHPNAGRAGLGDNNVNWIVEIVTSTSQMGTHLDALNHLQSGNRFYNGLLLEDIAEAWGTNRLGIETVPQILTRGLLLNVAALHKKERLEKGYVITVADAQACLSEARISVKKGDALLMHTGWGELWQEKDEYLSGEPGPGIELAAWLVEQGVALSGCDTWSYGPVPPEDPRKPFFVPQTLNVKHGLFIVENLHTALLAEEMAKVEKKRLACEFMFILTHARLRGATGAWVSPVAVL